MSPLPHRSHLQRLWLLLAWLTLAAAPAFADAQTRERDWWRFEGNEYWNLFFPKRDKERPEPATIEAVEGVRVLNIRALDQPVAIGVYGGNRQKNVSLLRELQRIDFRVALEAGPPMQVVLTLRDAKGEKWRFTPKTLDRQTETITWRYPEDVEEVYHGDPPNKQVDDALHLFNLRFTRPGSDEASRIVLRGAAVTEYVPATEAIKTSLKTTAEYPVIYKQDAGAAAVVVENTSAEARRGSLTMTVTERDGGTQHKTHAFTLDGGAARAFPMTLGLQTYGVKTLDMTVAVDGDTRTDTTRFAYLDPVGNEGGRDDPFGFWIGGAKSETDYAIMAAIGVEGVRMGRNWVHNEKNPREYDWEPVDREVEAFQRHGFLMHYLVSYGHPRYAREPWATQLKGKRWSLQTAPPRLDEWTRYVRDLATRYDGRIMMWEIWNEPDLSSFWKGSTDDYLELLRETHRVLKAVNADNQVMTGGFATATYHGGHALNPDLQERVLSEAASFFDVHTHHQHGRFRGFRAAIDGPLARWRSGPAGEKPLVFNETALSYKQAGGEWEQAEELVKKMSFAFARGAEAYAWFVFYAGGGGHVSEFAMIHGPRNQPRPALAAYNELARQLRDTVFVEQLEADSGRLILRFADAARGEEVFVLWHENNNLARRPLMLRVPDGVSVQLIDLMGNAAVLPVHDGLASVDVEPTPSYLRIKADPTRAGVGPGGVTVLAPLMALADDAITIDEQGSGRARVMVTNPAPQPATLTMTWQTEGRLVDKNTIRLDPDQQKIVAIDLEIAEPEAEPRLLIEASVASLNLTHTLEAPIVATRALARGPIRSRPPDFMLADADHVVNYFMNDPASLSKNWGGPDDLSAKVWLTPTDDGLRVTVHVTDDVHQQRKGAGRLWQMDSIQIGVAALKQDGFYEIGAALHEDGALLKKVFVNPPGARLDVQTVKTDIQRDGQTTRYDLTVPWRVFGEDRPSGVRFNVVINDADEGAREGLIRISPGIDEKKDPNLFPILSIPAEE